ncbi:hypothetical protein SAMN05444157_0136 [Frankineae bacterium MT45]|nr:hypothetical protein SAMN05444157_0136 [Frankineae bacterium MT45]
MTQTRSKAPDPATPDPKATPNTIKYAFWALVASGVFLVIGALLRFGFTSELTKQLIDANNKAKTPKSPYGPAEVAHDLHTVRVVGLIEQSLFAVLFVVLGLQLMKGKGWARWIIVVLAILTRLPFYVVAFGGNGSVLIRANSVLTGATFIAALALIFIPVPSRRFFAAHRPVRDPNQAPTVGLGSLFAPRKPAAPAAGANGGAAKTGKVTLSKDTSATASATAQGGTTAAGGAAAKVRAKSKSRVAEPTPGAAPSVTRGKTKGR